MDQRPPLRIACVDFWPGFEPPHLGQRHPLLHELARIEWSEDPASADLTFFSCFPERKKDRRPRDPRAVWGCPGPRVYYSAENIPVDFRQCDFAITFSRTLQDPRHLRLPNYVGRMAFFGFPPDALERLPSDPQALLAQKTRFAMFIQGNPVPFREDFVRRLSRYKRVDCAGPALNNMGFLADRMQKFALYREAKFAVTFENESALGYTTEKLPEAFLGQTVPIYWGDPGVALDFNPGALIQVAGPADVEAAIERLIAIDRDDEAYLRLLCAPRFPAEGPPTCTDPANQRRFFTRLLQAATRRNRPSGLRPILT
jgi:hypothetical protein